MNSEIDIYNFLPKYPNIENIGDEYYMNPYKKSFNQAIYEKKEFEKFKGGNFKVGITWSGSGHYAGKKNSKRDIHPEEIAKLIRCFDEANIEFHSLQIEESKNNSLRALVTKQFFSHEKFLMDFSDTAALLSQMDLVVSIDTATAHLAGALNIPTLLLIPDPPDFMALTDRVDSPWYPSISIVRQIERDKWPIELVAEKISKFMQ